MKSLAPSLVASIAVSIVACPEIIITGNSVSDLFAQSFSRLMPSSSGIHISRKTKSGFLLFASILASSAEEAVEVEYPSSFKIS